MRRSSGTPPRCTKDRPCPTVSAGAARRPWNGPTWTTAGSPRGGPGGLRRVVYSGLQLVAAVGVAAPLAVGVVVALAATVPGLDELRSSLPADLASAAFYGNALIASLVVFAGAAVLGLAVVTTVPRLLNLAIRPDTTYPLYGVRYALHRAIARLTNVPFFTYLFGDSSYIVNYLHWIGYDLSRVEQTGSNFGLEVKHETPFGASVGSGTMAADGLSIVNADFSSTSFRVSRAAIGRRSFLGNYVTYPSQSRAADNCLLATKVMVPVDGDVREGIGLLGSPSFEIPRSVQRDGRFDHLSRGAEFRKRRAPRTATTSPRWGCSCSRGGFHVFGLTVIGAGAIALYGSAGAAAIAGGLVLALPFTASLLRARRAGRERLPRARPPVLLDLRPVFLVARALLEARRAAAAGPQRHAVQDARLARPRRGDR